MDHPNDIGRMSVGASNPARLDECGQGGKQETSRT
jgi:hypothetical protein